MRNYIYEKQENVQIDVQKRENRHHVRRNRARHAKSGAEKVPGPDNNNNNIAVELLRFDGEVTLNKLYRYVLRFGQSNRRSQC